MTKSPTEAAMGNSLLTLLATRKYSDLTILAGINNFISCHQAIVCSLSPVIGAKVDRWKNENEDGTRFDMREEDPRCVQAFIEFLYTGRYDLEQECWLADPTSGQSAFSKMVAEREELVPPIGVPGRQYPGIFPSNSWLMPPQLPQYHPGSFLPHVKMYIMGNFYDVPALQDYAAEQVKYQATCSKALDDDEFTTAVEHLYQDITRDKDTLMKSVVGGIILHNLYVVRKFDSLADRCPRLQSSIGLFSMPSSLGRRYGRVTRKDWR